MDADNFIEEEGGVHGVHEGRTVEAARMAGGAQGSSEGGKGHGGQEV